MEMPLYTIFGQIARPYIKKGKVFITVDLGDKPNSNSEQTTHQINSMQLRELARYLDSKKPVKCVNCGCTLKIFEHPDKGFFGKHSKENELAYCVYHGCDKPRYE